MCLCPGSGFVVVLEPFHELSVLSDLQRRELRYGVLCLFRGLRVETENVLRLGIEIVRSPPITSISIDGDRQRLHTFPSGDR